MRQSWSSYFLVMVDEQGGKSTAENYLFLTLYKELLQWITKHNHKDRKKYKQRHIYNELVLLTNMIAYSSLLARLYIVVIYF